MAPLYYFFALLAPALWAGNFVVARAVHEPFPPLTLNCFRWLVAAAALVPLFGRSAWHARRELKANWKWIVLLGLTGVVGFNSTLYLGLQHTTAVSAAMIFSITPLIIIVLSACLCGTYISRAQTGAVLLSVSGAIVVLGRHFNTVSSEFSGDLIVLVSCLIWASYCVLIKTVQIKADSGTILLTTVLFRLLIQLPLSISEIAVVGMPTIDLSGLAAILYLGGGAAALAFFVWQHAVAELGPASCGVFLNLIPVFGVALSMTFLGERLATHHVLGAICVATGIGLAQINWQRRLRSSPE
ncbi:MAG: DMT family transporter [Xanthobacteraceae bacterium]|nr:DMT family transporter [Xanthobacteraceae bacterium]